MKGESIRLLLIGHSVCRRVLYVERCIYFPFLREKAKRVLHLPYHNIETDDLAHQDGGKHFMTSLTVFLKGMIPSPTLSGHEVLPSKPRRITLDLIIRLI